MNGTIYHVYLMILTLNTYGKTKYFDQLNNNFVKVLALVLMYRSLITGSTTNTYARSKLDLENLKLQRDKSNQTLQSNIYTAYTNAVAAFEKYILE